RAAMIVDPESKRKRRLSNIGLTSPETWPKQKFASGNLSEIIGQFFFFDDKESIFIGLDQSKMMKSLHEQTDSGPRRADHLGQLLVRNLELDADAARVFLAHGAGELQQSLAEPLLAIDRHQVGDDLLLIGDARRQIAHEPLRQRVARKTREKLRARNLLERRGFHRRCGFQTRAQAAQTQLAENVAVAVDGQQAFP